MLPCPLCLIIVDYLIDSLFAAKYKKELIKTTYHIRSVVDRPRDTWYDRYSGNKITSEYYRAMCILNIGCFGNNSWSICAIDEYKGVIAFA